jgi:hypothetical protein
MVRTAHPTSNHDGYRFVQLVLPDYHRFIFPSSATE